MTDDIAERFEEIVYYYKTGCWLTTSRPRTKPVDLLCNDWSLHRADVAVHELIDVVEALLKREEGHQLHLDAIDAATQGSRSALGAREGDPCWTPALSAVQDMMKGKRNA